MKFKLLFWFLILTQFLAAQSFTEVSHFNAFEGVYGSSTAIVDVNGDIYPDVLVTGQKSGRP